MMGKRKGSEKDLRFALEHTGARLIRTIIHGTGKFEYTISPDNIMIDEKIVQKLEREGYFATADEGLFPGMPQSYRPRAQHG
jgi:hypothetical protein